MAFGRSDWPLTGEQLRHVISLGETTLVELKQEWWDLASSEGKARLARQVIALANTVGREELGLIVFGIVDARHGGGIRPVTSPPTEESVSQILAGYSAPPTNVQCRHHLLEEGLVSVLAVLHSEARRHHATREHPGVLSPRDAYVRRDKQVGFLTSQ